MTKEKKEKKRHGLRNFLIYCFILAAVWYVGTFTLKTTEVSIESEKISDPVTIVQLTDLHGSEFGKNNEYLIEAVKEAQPDFVVGTGDMYTSGDKEGMKVAIKLMKQLSSLYQVYFVTGEHDYQNEQYLDSLREVGVKILDYQWEDITIGQTVVRLYGIDNAYYSKTFDLCNEFQCNSAIYNILVAHIANFDAFAEFGMDLSLCGDTHGGQIRLPGIGALTTGENWLPEKKSGAEQYVKGLYERDGKYLFVSSGLGSHPVPIRFCNRPEVAVIHLQPA